MKKTTYYLYGCKPSAFASLTYEEALWFRVNAATEQLKKLRERAYEALRRDDHARWTLIAKQYVDVENARQFNRALLGELNEQ